MNLAITRLKRDLENKQVIKIIAGLSNFNVTSVIKTVKAAEIAESTYVDVASNPKLVKILKSLTHLPVCVSSIDPQELYDCLLAGADILEIGNFDAFYSKYIYFSTSQIINLTKEIQSFSKNNPLCVTIPHILSLSDQLNLVQQLQKLDVTMVQTEGSTNKTQLIPMISSPIIHSTNLSSSTLSASYKLSKYTNIPVIASSCINSLSASIAISHGASGIGICSALQDLNLINQKVDYINQLKFSISSYRTGILTPLMKASMKVNAA
uniref:Uncharacterized protein ycf23 n=1 Tax=Gelidium elegans TaxID=37200 RepID=A0A141SDH8_GELEL|nr:hypothetical protein Gele_091 [Gelidium elegans]AMK96346.1 hypothetical protein Gele_091 [Gelidium elegans]